MYRFLKAEMIKANISVPKLAKKIGVSEKTLRNKINESTECSCTVKKQATENNR